MTTPSEHNKGPDPLEVASNPDWFLHQLDLFNDRALLLRINKSVYHNSMFLDERMAIEAPASSVMSLSQLSRSARKQRSNPLRLIFHLSHCGSTMISRLLQSAAPILALREPGSIRALAAFLRDLGHPLSLLGEQQYQRLEDLILQQLARCYPDQQCALVKAGSDCSILAHRVLEIRPDARLVLLYLPLESFLATMLRSDLRRQETQALAQSRLSDLHLVPGCEEIRIHTLDPGQLAAMSWVSNLHQLQAAASSYQQRCELFNFESFLDDPTRMLAKMSQCLDLNTTPESIASAVSGPLMQAYSKDPAMRYDQQARQAELARCRDQFAEQIESGFKWAVQLATRVSVLTPVGELINH